jgi:drug/metabolite transporter (DMT)-like permease
MASVNEIPPGSASVSRRNQAVGIGLVILSTLCIALVPTFAKLAYDGGSNTLSIITGRGIASVFIAFPLMILLGQPITLPRWPFIISTVAGVLYAVMLYCYIGAVQYLAVNLVILIFFIHPLLVGFIVALLGYEKLRPVALVALVGALVGLGLAIGFSFDALDGTGILLSTIAMVLAACTIISNARAARHAPGLTVVSYMMLSAAVSLLIIFPFFGTLAVPTTGLGWLGFAGVAIGATTGTLTFFYGMTFIGAARAAMISNIEPVIGIVFAMAILGEQLSLIQGFGIALVLGSIVSMEIWR